MGATNGYARPVEPVDGRISSWRAHINRGVPSSEPGTDYYVPIGTPLRAAASGVVSEIGTSIQPATGYFIKINLDDGRSVRYLHLSQIDVRVGQRVQWGEIIGLTGATGYGEVDWSWNVAETGGAHTHMTVFPTHYYPESWNRGGKDRYGNYYTIDPEPLMSPNQGGAQDDAALRRRKENATMYVKGSRNDVYAVDSVWNNAYPKGQVRMRLCTSFEAQAAIVGGLVITVDDGTLTNLGKVSGYPNAMPKS